MSEDHTDFLTAMPPGPLDVYQTRKQFLMGFLNGAYDAALEEGDVNDARSVLAELAADASFALITKLVKTREHLRYADAGTIIHNDVMIRLALKCVAADVTKKAGFPP